MSVTLADLLASPDYYPHSLDGGEALFVPMSAAAYRDSIFLDGRIRPAADGVARVPLAALSAPPAQPTGFIFHIAHCGSTLLARALEQATGTLVLREPMALRQLALAPDDALLGAMLGLLSRRYAPALPTLVKANVPVNFILPQIARHQPEGRAILLHSGLGDWALAVLRSPDHRDWVRRVSGLLADHVGPTESLSDAQCAVALWVAQTRAFHAALDLWPGAAVLDSEAFFADPAGHLATAAAHLGLDAPAGRIAQAVSGPLFRHDAKRPDLPFDNGRRLERRAATAAGLERELAEARAWLAHRPVPSLPADRQIAAGGS